MKPSTARVLRRLQAAGGGWVRGRELAEVGGFRFGGRIHELRHEFGYAVERRSDPRSAVDQYRIVPDGAESAVVGAEPADHLSVPDSGSPHADLAYANTKRCGCGALIPEPEPGTRGRRPRLCARCKQTRRALSYIRAGERILDSLKEPEAIAS